MGRDEQSTFYSLFCQKEEDCSMQNTRNQQAEHLKQILGLSREPVAVKFFRRLPRQLADQDFASRKSRYCQALIRASGGEKVLVTADSIACPASAATNPTPAQKEIYQRLGLDERPLPTRGYVLDPAVWSLKSRPCLTV